VLLCFVFDCVYCRAALQRSDRKEPRYKWPTLLYFTLLSVGAGFPALKSCLTQIIVSSNKFDLI